MSSIPDRVPVAPSPLLVGRRVRLQAVRSDDYEWIESLSILPELGFRWRHPPGTLNPDQLRTVIWQGVLVQFVIVHKAYGDRLGLVMAYQASPANRTAYVAIVLDPGVHRVGWPLEGFRLFMGYLFDAFDLRKVYAEVVDYNLIQYRGLIGRGASEEGRLRSHVFIGGRHRDVHILALYRSDWSLATVEGGERSSTPNNHSDGSIAVGADGLVVR